MLQHRVQGQAVDDQRAADPETRDVAVPREGPEPEVAGVEDHLVDEGLLDEGVRRGERDDRGHPPSRRSALADHHGAGAVQRQVQSSRAPRSARSACCRAGTRRRPAPAPPGRRSSPTASAGAHAVASPPARPRRSRSRSRARRSTRAATSPRRQRVGVRRRPTPTTAPKNTAPMTAWPTARPIRCAVCSTPPAVLPDDRVDVHQRQRLVRRDDARREPMPITNSGRASGQRGVRRRRADAATRASGSAPTPKVTQRADHQRPADPGHHPAGQSARRRPLPSAYAVTPSPDSQRGVAEAVLVVQRQHERQAGHARGKNSQRQQRRRPCTTAAGTAAGRPAGRARCRVSRALAPAEDGTEQTSGRHAEPGQPRVRTASYSTAANSTQKVAEPSSSDADDVEPVAARRRCRSGRQPPRQRDHDDADRHVDEEDQPPAEVGAAERDQRAADERPERRADARPSCRARRRPGRGRRRGTSAGPGRRPAG